MELENGGCSEKHNLFDIRHKFLVYDKALMGQYVGHLWDRELNSDSALIVKNRNITFFFLSFFVVENDGE